MNSKELKALYERVYAEGKEQFFTFSTADASKEVLSELDWRSLDVLEVGCGTGETAYMIAEARGNVLATDYAEGAIAEARRRHSHANLAFEVASFDDIQGLFDAIVMQETIEHLDDPRETLAMLKDHLAPSGNLIVTCPSFLNLRGHVWMTLQLLLDVPMSLTDRHFISPFDMEKWAGELGLDCRWRTFRYTQAHGQDMIVDMKKRLTNALRDAGLDNTKVDALLNWLDQARRYEPDAVHNGAKGFYRLTPIGDRKA